ncbi:hypothetical protein H4582DRAFT_746751 [Lactarius indigo]|nr:hypothetical protein H4582DRAFT_746751 [Lactarius indigo]
MWVLHRDDISLHYAAEDVTIHQWSRCSDHVARKPILLLGLTGSVVSTILFDLPCSLNFVLGTFPQGMIAELTDETPSRGGFRCCRWLARPVI